MTLISASFVSMVSSSSSLRFRISRSRSPSSCSACADDRRKYPNMLTKPTSNADRWDAAPIDPSSAIVRGGTQKSVLAALTTPEKPMTTKNSANSALRPRNSSLRRRSRSAANSEPTTAKIRENMTMRARTPSGPSANHPATLSGTIA